ncbi:MAG: Xaa-Pro peptidase family protein [Candidatus Bathyarchaeia archaeon]
MRKDIDKILEERGAEALLLYSESFKNANMYYLTKFLAPDPFIFLKRVNDAPVIVVNQMEHPRAKKESMVKDVRSYVDYNYLEIVKSTPEPNLGVLKFVSAVAKKELGTKTKICVPPDFPAMAIDVLRKDGLTVVPMFDVIEKARETKDADEVNEIKAVQAVVEKVTGEVIDLIADADVAADGTLTIKTNGKKEPLTVQKLKSIFGYRFIDNGCIMEEGVAVACGPKSADPHYSGSPEDKLKANQPIVFDVFPRSLRKRYWSDMTRTVVKGKAPKEVKKMFEAVLEAKNASTDALKAGVLGSEVYDVCCNVLEKAGYATTRGGKSIPKGFVHGLGHGVGLEIHEDPRMNEVYKFALKEHSVVTVEPGLYDPEIGGVRIEDIVEITKTGCDNFTKMEIVLEL